MERREKENGGENNPNKYGDHTHNTPDPDNESHDMGVGLTDPAEHAKENGKTDDTQNKRDTSQGVQGTTREAQSGMVQSAEPSIERKSASLKEETKEACEDEKPKNEIPVIDHDNGASQIKEDEQFNDANANTDTTEVSQTIQFDSSACEDEKPKNEIPVIDHDNGASQREEDEQFNDANANTDTREVSQTIQLDSSDDNPALPSEHKQSGSKNFESESGSSASGGKLEEEKEAQKRDLTKGRSNEEKDMETGTKANKDDPEKGRPEKEKAKGEGDKGESGIEDAVKTEERVVKERPVSISLCTSAYSFNVEGLVSYLKSLMEENPKLIKEVKVHVLPYNDIDHYKFPVNDPVDVMILCHSINNRRFAITDVMDALYDAYLPYCARVIGKEKMGVIVHDFDDMRETVQSSRMSSFKYKQPKAFETTSLQITCGHIEKEEQVLKQMLQADREKIVGFLEHASKYPEEMQKEETNWKESLTSLKRFIPDLKIPSFAGFGLSGREKEGQIQEPTALRSMGSNTQTAEPVQKNQGMFYRNYPQKNKGSHTAKRTRDETQSPCYGRAKRKYSSKDGTPVDPQPESSVEGNTEPDPPRDASPATQQSSGAVYATAASGTQGTVNLPSQQQMARNSKKAFTSAPQSSSPTPRRISVSVCSSAYKRNVKGLLSWFAKFQAEQSHMITDVRFRQLPYNDIDSFKFPQNDPVDVMVLCHSVDNRGFSITNVENAIYEKYLKYCNKLIGKKKLAVIVHDFADCKPAIVESRMESFRRMQKLTFELVDTVIICGSLEDSDKLGIRKDDETRLIRFLEFARFEPKENLKQSLLGKLF